MDNRPLLYTNYDVVYQEIPDEVSLAINISGCPHHCWGCHSRNLWYYTGKPLLKDLALILEKYKEYVTCVCFMGGDQNIGELNDAIFRTTLTGLKAALYSGCDDVPEGLDIDSLSYLKIGRYDKHLGGLDSPETNQRFYEVKKLQIYRGHGVETHLEDITYKFRKNKE